MRITYNRLILFFIIFSLQKMFLAQNPDWIVYDTSNSNLPSNFVTSIAEDVIGDIWVGTSGGLVKISGNFWTVYTVLNSNLPSNRVETIAIDTNNVMWIGLSGAGIVKYHNDIWEHFTTQNSILPSDQVNQIVVDKINRKWIATETGYGAGGVLVIDDTSWISYTEYNSALPVGTVCSIDVDDSLVAWIGMYYIIPDPGPILGGLASFNGFDWEFYDYNTPGFSTGYLNYIEADKDTIWVGTDWGLSKFNGSEWFTFLEDSSGLPNNYVNTVFADSNGTKWIGVGRAHFDRKGAFVKYSHGNFFTFDTTNSPIPPGYITSIFIDSQRNKWIAIQPYWDQSTTPPYGGGLAIYNENGIIFNLEDIVNPIPNENILLNNFPNPFNSSTTIEYVIPNKGIVKLEIYDILGRHISTVINKYQTIGKYDVNYDALNLPSGIYTYTIRCGNAIKSNKMLILR